MALFGTENSIEPGPKQAATTRKVEASEASETQPRGITFSASINFGQKKAKNEELDAVAKQHGFYTANRSGARRYYNDYQQKSEVMRASESKITTRLDDRQTVGAMLDLAKERGWDSVTLRGTADFKREAWVQAQTRGIATQGYTPKDTDIQEAARRTAAAAPVASKPTTAAAKDIGNADTPAVPPKARTNMPKQETDANQTTEAQKGSARQRQERTAKPGVWGEVETNGRQARQQDAASTGVKQQARSAKAAA